MARFLCVLFLGVFLTGCITPPDKITRFCNAFHPMPDSVGNVQNFGLLGLSVGYFFERDQIARVNQERAACIEQQKAAGTLVTTQ